MALLVTGLVLWSFVHLGKALAPNARSRLTESLGEMPYKAVVSLLLVASIALMVLGYKAATGAVAYRPPSWGHGAGTVVAVVGMILFVASGTKTNIKRYLRHPQMLSVVLWSAGHLLAGGQWRAVVLFGGLALWAIAEVWAINRRDGVWQRPGLVPAKVDVIVVVIGLLLSAVLIGVHEWRGISVISG